MTALQPLIRILRRYPLACGGSLLLVIVLTVFALRYSLLGEAQQKSTELLAQAETFRRNAQNATGLDKEVETLKDGLVELQKRMISPDDVATNQQYFYKMEADCGVKISRLNLQTLAKAGKTAATSFRPIGFSLALEGGMARLLAFVRSLESGSRPYSLTGFNMVRGTGQTTSPEGTAVGVVVLTLNFELLSPP